MLSQENLSDKDIKGHGINGKVLKSDRLLAYNTLIKSKIDLPADLQYRLLLEADQNPNYINKYLNERHKQDVMGGNCFLPINRTEFENYIESNQPFLYGEFIATSYKKNNAYHAIITRPLNNDFSYSFYNSNLFSYKIDRKGNKEIGFDAFDEAPFNCDYQHDNLYKKSKIT